MSKSVELSRRRRDVQTQDTLQMCGAQNKERIMTESKIQKRGKSIGGVSERTRPPELHLSEGSELHRNEKINVGMYV